MIRLALNLMRSLSGWCRSQNHSKCLLELKRNYGYRYPTKKQILSAGERPSRVALMPRTAQELHLHDGRGAESVPFGFRGAKVPNAGVNATLQEVPLLSKYFGRTLNFLGFLIWSSWERLNFPLLGGWRTEIGTMRMSGSTSSLYAGGGIRPHL